MYVCVSQSTTKPEHKISKTEGTTPGSLNTPHGQTDLSVKPDNVKIKGLQANVTIPKVCVSDMVSETDRNCIDQLCLILFIWACVCR